MSKLGKNSLKSSFPTDRDDTLLFWIKLLVIFLFLNITLYSLQLAAQLSGCAPPPPLARPTVQTTSEPTTLTRTVKVLAVVDSWHQIAHPQWQETVRHTIDNVSRLYQKEFGIAFELVGVRAWNTSHAVTMPDELAALKRAYPITTDYDVVIGVTNASGLVVAGISEILGNHLLVAATPFHSLTDLLAHELGHIFGARDTASTVVAQIFAGPLVSATLPESFTVAIREQKWRLFRLPSASPVIASTAAYEEKKGMVR
jgi:hypothetical protein